MTGRESDVLRLLDDVNRHALQLHAVVGEKPAKVQPVPKVEAREAETLRRGLPD